jgi:hypothetical protein
MKNVRWVPYFVAMTIASGVAACADDSRDSDDEDLTETGTGASGAGTPTSRSGETICNDTADCGAGMSCEHSTLGPSGVCAENCSSPTECSTDTLCVDGAEVGFDSSCLARCQNSADCGAGLGCFQLNDGSTVCMPNDWGSDPPTTKGIGDACSSDADCSSSWCLGGWCSEACSPSDAGCWGDYEGKNEFGQWNWCVLNNAGNYVCFPGCSAGSSVCSSYDDASCQSATDAEGTSTSICSG